MAGVPSIHLWETKLLEFGSVVMGVLPQVTQPVINREVADLTPGCLAAQCWACSPPPQKGALQISDLSPDEWPPPLQGLQGTPTHIFCNGILRPWVISMTTRVFPQALPPGCPSPLCSLRACRGSPGWVGSHWRLDTEGLLEAGRVGVCK